MRDQALQAAPNGVYTLERVHPYGITRAACLAANIPSAAIGFAYGCVLHALDATTEVTVQYVNTGTLASCTFTADRRDLLVSERIVTLTGTTTITAALHEGKILLMGASGAALTFTLPAATGSGGRYRFVVSVVNTSNYIITALAGDLMCGNILTNSSGDSVTVEPWISLVATANIKITLDGTTKGGVSIGDYIDLVDIATDRWQVSGLTTSSGTEATPFSTS